VASVSVITIAKNHAAGLAATHQSLLEQSFNDWEMVIVVGVSSDATLAVAKDLQRIESRILLIEQSGSGIYEAMNEGLAAASGEFTWFMNAGDKFATASTLVQAVGHISQNKVGVVIGGYCVEGSSQNKIYSYPPGNITGLSFAFNRRGGCHQAMIFQTSVLKDLGGFNTSYSLAADFDLVLKVIQMSKASRVSEIYASIEPGGRADQGIFLVHNQKHQIRKNLLGGPVVFLASLLWTALARMKIILRRTINI
jgi:glycosyltransferase involved in cell wall biosynthesis